MPVAIFLMSFGARVNEYLIHHCQNEGSLSVSESDRMGCEVMFDY